MDGPYPSEIRRQVEDICHSRQFAAAGRYRELLNYIVERRLDGESVTETSIALDVYKKNPLIYHPSVDAVGRTQKRKLVERLKQFYVSDHGKRAPIAITIDGYEAKWRYTGVKPPGLSFTNLCEAHRSYVNARQHFIEKLHELGFVSPESNGYGRILAECQWNESSYETVLPYDYVYFRDWRTWDAVEFMGVKPASRLSVEAQVFIKEQGFPRAILNHTDGITTYYVLPSRGFRIKNVEGNLIINYEPDEPEYHLLLRNRWISDTDENL